MDERTGAHTDRYAQRLLDRQRMINMSPENRSKTQQRRLSVMQALQRYSITPPQVAGNRENPFKKEFRNEEPANEELNVPDMSFVSTWPEIEEPDRAQNSSKNQSDPNANNIAYRKSNEYKRSAKKEERSSAEKFFDTPPFDDTPGELSFRDEDINRQKFLGEIYEKDFDSGRQEANGLFPARVLEVIEPEVVMAHRKENRDSGFTFEAHENLEFDSVTTSFLSSRIDEIDREMGEMHLQQDEPMTLEETPKRLYPNLSLMKRLSNNFTPKKLFHGEQTEAQDLNPASNTKETYATPAYSPETPPGKQEQKSSRPGSSASFLKRNASIIYSNLRLPKIRSRPADLESTRKPQGKGKLVSPSWMGTTISTLTMPCDTPKSLDNIPGEKSAEMPYEVENFLELALGDYNPDVTYAKNMMDSQSQVNASELISEDRTPIRSRRQTAKVPMTEPPKYSSTLNRSLSFCKTLTQRIKSKFRSNVRGQPIYAPPHNPNAMDVAPTLKDSVKKLLEAVDVQQTLIYQSSKALELCNSMLEFVVSDERVESERLLLLANLRKKAALDEIRRLAGLQNGEETQYKERADITLTNLSVQLRDSAWRQQRRSGDQLDYLMVVVTCGTVVWASEAVACPANGTRLTFPGKLTVPSLPPSFKFHLRIYHLTLKQLITYRHEDKYHITNTASSQRASTTCPSPKDLLKKSDKRRNFISPKQYEIKLSGIKESSFTPCGSNELSLHDLTLLPPWPLHNVPSDSILHGTIELSLSSDLRLSTPHAGFLTVGEEAGGFVAWNRRWCVLDGRYLFFWNYPREQESKPPMYVIDLADCLASSIKVVDRTMCARPRTLFVETARKRTALDRNSVFVECRASYTIIKNLLSCDTNQELTEWQAKLNHVVTALREWNIIETFDEQVSDL